MTISRGQHLIGKVLGSCVLEKLLGYGGSSAVFLAQQQQPERKVAIKVFLPRSVMDTRMQREFYHRFLLEADAASKLDHPNILPIYSYGEQDGLPYIVMPYMSGGTLGEYIAQRGPLSLEEAQWYLEQVAVALDYAHEHGCVHCDVKPANMLLDDEGHLMLSDFGIARVTQTGETATPAGAKGSEALVGTPDYISPEQALGRTLDGRSDVYSLGITLFYLLAQQFPFKADSTLALALLHVHEPPPSLALLRADVTPEIDRVIHQALAKEPKGRFQTASTFIKAFAEAVVTAREEAKLASPGKQVKVLPRGKGNASETPHVLIPYRPIIKVKPLAAYKADPVRVIGIVFLLLVLIGTTSFAVRSIMTQILNGKARGATGAQTLTTSNINSAKIDQLSNRANWPLSSTFFYDTPQNRYHILNKSAKDVALAFYTGHQFSNFRLSITIQEIHSSPDAADYYGIVFRSAADQTHYYLFEVSREMGGQYAFWLYDGQWKSLAAGSAPMLQSDLQKSNTLVIEANKNTFTFQINGQVVRPPVTDTSKTPLTKGQIGLYVEDQGTEVAFSHLLIEPLP
ncbi:MAG TPA: protein kinase [Ktedonobacteraceae bacterium]|nr:protein kinase [Ktedonobacteraceae bacterium]